ncbi:MAG: hypothetical protein EKK64_05630 [Neisseriaceae bacterium]|jgi:cell division transport system permease protein|nr:MAG: hypothetical protein EKK64_05630 [Neisseriaceae bacterium]
MNFIYRQLRVFKHAWQIILSKPIEHFINLVALGLIISLCMTSLSVNKSMHVWEDTNIVYPQIYVYMDNQANDADLGVVQKLLTSSEHSREIANYKYVSKDEALHSVTADNDMKSIASEVISSDSNPLPDVFIVNTSTLDAKSLELLTKQLQATPMVDNVQIDVNYANKISDLISFASNISFAVQALLIGVLCLFVYNIIRLQMMLKSDAIKVSRLIGASDGFIMAPLLQYAFWQVSLATITGAVIQVLIAKQINGLFAHFTHLFSDKFVVNLLCVSDYFMIWLEIVAFALLSVFLAVRWVLNHTRIR